MLARDEHAFVVQVDRGLAAAVCHTPASWVPEETDLHRASTRSRFGRDVPLPPCPPLKNLGRYYKETSMWDRFVQFRVSCMLLRLGEISC